MWIDRRYEDAASLKAAAEIMLSELQEPLVSYSVGFHELTASDYDKAAIGKRVRIIFPEVGDSVDTYITELTRKRDDLKESTITVATGRPLSRPLWPIWRIVSGSSRPTPRARRRFTVKPPSQQRPGLRGDNGFLSPLGNADRE